MTEVPVDVGQQNKILMLLPGYNCGICGYARCDEFAGALTRKKKWTWRSAVSSLRKCSRMIWQKYRKS